MTNPKLSKYLLQLALHYKTYLLSLCAIAIIASTFEVLTSYKIKEILDIIAENKGATITSLIFLFVLYKFLHHGMFFISRLLDIRYKPQLTTHLTEDIYKKTIKHSLSWFDSHMSGEISDKINSFQVSLTHLITNLFRSLTIIAVIIIGISFLIKIHILPALVLFAFLLIYSPILWILLRKQMHLQENFTNANQRTTGIINDSISNIFSIKIIGNIVNEFNLKLKPALIERQKWDKITRQFDAYAVDNVDTLMSVIMAATQIYIMTYLYQSNQITAGGFAFIAIITLRIHGDIDELLNYILFGINPQIAEIRASYSFINEKYECQDQKNATTLENVKGHIKFENVNFSYDQNKAPALDNFNLDIQAGEKVGIVGHSGAGKTTLIKSLLRYFDIDNGKILIDNNDISQISQDSLRFHLSLIPQDITMFHRSILDNLRIAKYEASLEEIMETCKKARIHDDIMQMTDGYNSIVGERGVKVSGGQRQRIAIARAILKDAPILILDEATSSLDSKTEKEIQQSLNILIEDKAKTVIAIAHRLSTLKHMDRIIVIDQGKVVEEGKHDLLIKNENSLYKKLWELQEI